MGYASSMPYRVIILYISSISTGVPLHVSSAVQMPKRVNLDHYTTHSTSPSARLTVGGTSLLYGMVHWSPPAAEFKQMVRGIGGKRFCVHDTKDLGPKRGVLLDSRTDEGNAPAFAKVQY